jgi:TPP-dependent pyruvate/acetoin dehydrogenase alpha subunit
MAVLWKLPVVYILENHQFGMGSSKNRHAHNSEFYSRYDSIPGCAAMDWTCTLFVKPWRWPSATALQERGPILLELDTYRYHVSHHKRGRMREAASQWQHCCWKTPFIWNILFQSTPSDVPT